MHIRQMQEEPFATDYIGGLRQEEDSQQVHSLPSREITLGTDGRLLVGGQAFSLSAEAAKDVANLGRIPVTYFNDMDPELRAINLNQRLPNEIGRDTALSIISNGSEVSHVRRQGLPRVASSRILETLVEGIPGSISNGSQVAVSSSEIRADIRAIEYHRNGQLDVAFVSPALETQPLRGDVVCGGVHLTVEETGAVQIGAISYRLICSNGAMTRVCLGKGGHRIRRGDGQDSERNFFNTLREFGRGAWQEWTRVADGLRQLAERPIEGSLDRLVNRLRQSPFFISAAAAKRVLAVLRAQGNDRPTMYDLHNAITNIGSHQTDVLWRYRYRLRLGAGALARGRAGVCRECQQLVLA